VESFIFGVVIVAIVAVAVAVSVAETRHRHARRRDFDALQASRPPLPAADFAAECGVPESIADRIRRVLAAVSEESYANPREPVEAARLRPDDDVCQELGYDLDSLSFFDLLNWPTCFRKCRSRSPSATSPVSWPPGWTNVMVDKQQLYPATAALPNWTCSISATIIGQRRKTARHFGIHPFRGIKDMLVRLFGRNFRSFKAPFELSMVAADLRRKEDQSRGVIEVPIAGAAEPLRLLRTVAIFGPNASGKSTILEAAEALRWVVTHSSARSKPDHKIPRYEPFLLDAESRTSPVELGCDVVCGQSLLRYEIAYNAKAFQRETLSVFDENGETRLIDRPSPGEVCGDLISRSAVNRLYVKEMQPNVAVLSKLAQHGPSSGEESVQPFYRAIRDATCGRDYSNAAAMQVRLGDSRDDRFADDAEYREWIMRHLIRSADVGICDVQTRREEVPESLRDAFVNFGAGPLPEKRVVVTFLHEGTSNQPIDFSRESSGTRKLFSLASDWWALANKPITIFADELSASLHPRLLDNLIRAVNDVPPGKAPSQLVFATHDTGLLEGRDGLPPALRRDQVYFTRKDSLGASELYSLAEFKDDARTVHNLRKRYLSGLYGAIPSTERLSL
jgi:hypothetical protein